MSLPDDDIIIIRGKRMTIQKDLPLEDEVALTVISRRSAAGYSLSDALRVVRIVWRLLRS